jgi:hypothetical protein
MEKQTYQTKWISFGGVDISNSPKLHPIPINRFGIPEQQKKCSSKTDQANQ